jgi:RES domain-containing protein
LIRAWRIVKARHADDPLSGIGAALNPGRWNLRGVRMVYAAQSLSLAQLELLVHLADLSLAEDLVAKTIAVPDHVSIDTLAEPSLPLDWRETPAPRSTRLAGSEWARSRRTAILRVPSVVTPGEWNYLINPEHADWVSISVAERQPFAYDHRLRT